ncbi:LacI family DNA-binding transcriptional regulator [Pseudarthrobacter sp. NamB4]|uniref:LacI family DNA-binding transcriptional regulator n=1 Tax=Pseudarthrobacter sp. NamB4 TaxID=2576837 RepID=UPI00197A8AAB|nr:LacI family DNA-binding transcriptional regulator [Pseudarthrobacter sp. NamB4]
MTIKDVAAHAGVSLKTVSRVVNDENGVNPRTREAVRSSIAELGFRRNASAAGLRQRQAGGIGLIVEDISEPFQSAIARAVERVAAQNGVLLFTASSSQDADRDRELTLDLSSRPVDGLIIIPSNVDHGYVTKEIEAGLPVVFIDRPAVNIMADTVLSDNRTGARKGAEHLLKHGHRRIAFIGGSTAFFTGSERHLGSRDALGVVRSSNCTIHGKQPQHPRGPPRAHSVSSPTGSRSFDDFELLNPGVTAVAQDPPAMGTAAAELLFRRIAGDQSSAPDCAGAHAPY